MKNDSRQSQAPLKTLVSHPILVATACATCSCTGPHPLRGGRAHTAGPIAQTITQPENPAQPSTQNQETIRVRTYTLPAGSLLEPLSESPPLYTSPLQPPASSVHPSRLILSAPVPVTDREETRAATSLGAAQKDTARDLAAKLSSLKAIVWVGVGLFIFGLASIFWPPLQTIIGSLTTAIAITLGGVALMVLPTLIVGNELLILGGVAASVGAWFLAHRHGHLRGQLSASQSANSKPAPATPNSPQSPATPPTATN